MPRLLFEKTGKAIWISHLDLMRVFQRAFKRAGLPLTHTQGFNPRPSVSIALPLSVGVESVCELLDFDLEGDSFDCDEIRKLLNNTLAEGVRVAQVYDTGRKLRDLSLLHCQVILEYDNGVPDNAVTAISNLFEQESLIVQKKGKNGIQDQDIAPMIKRLQILAAGERELILDADICCQNPTLNPMQLVSAITTYLPQIRPDFAKCKRIEIFDNNMTVFR